MEDGVDELAMKIFTQLAAQYAVRHGMHDSQVQAGALVRESFTLAEAFAQEREARRNGTRNKAA